ncbi:MAG TPA: fumarylacetoacetate hydrolase family protein [Acidobacteriaceae bacterium]|nr:fumarylacetoacetate hydrolase family protein [Acidobacteriaceae bacterium]
MQYCRFQTEDGPQYGAVVHREGALWMEHIIAAPPEDLSVRRFTGSHSPRPLAELVLLAPVTPSKIVCIGRNYRDHAAELGNDVPLEPLLFLKAPSSLLAPGGVIRIPAISKRVDFEGELGVVIGRTCHKIGPEEDVRPYIRGYTIVNDVTARDLQKSDGQWSRGKGFDTFCPVGPVVTDEIDLQAGLPVITRLNGTIKQHGSTADLIFSIAALLRHISAAMTLVPGDLIPTGTPAGVGPMQPGDVVEVAIDGIGSLANPVDME